MGLIFREAKVRPLNEAVSETKRELQVRLRCYDRWVTDGKLSDVDATDRYMRLDAAATHLQALLEADPSMTVGSLLNAIAMMKPVASHGPHTPTP